MKPGKRKLRNKKKDQKRRLTCHGKVPWKDRYNIKKPKCMLYIFSFKMGSNLKPFVKDAGQRKESTGTGKANLLRLSNSGNYCYSNAVVSSLLTNLQFQHFLHQADDPSDQLVSELKSILGVSTNQVIFKRKLKTAQIQL